MKLTTKDILKWSIDYLKKAGVGEPRMDSEFLIAELLAREGHCVAYLEPSRAISDQDIFNFRSWVERRASREPVSYIVGHREFWSLNFNVTPKVLIPRPETEILVEQLLKVLRIFPYRDSARVLEIGTGSGNIAVAIASEIPKCYITALDICEGALGVAEENAKKHQVSKKIRFLKNDLFEANRIKNLGYFDFIASNPPYIDTKQLEHLMTDVKNFEPRLALDGGENGLRFYRHIIPRASDFLKEQGWLIMEIGWDQAEAVSKIIKDTDIYREPLVCLDYSGFPRVVMANKKKHG